MLYRKILKQLTYFFSTTLIIWGCGENSDSANNAPIETNNSITSSNDVSFIPSSSENSYIICQNGEVFTNGTKKYICFENKWVPVSQAVCIDGQISLRTIDNYSGKYCCQDGNWRVYNYDNTCDARPKPTYVEPCNINGVDNCTYGTLIDTRDQQTYKTVKIGTQWWMAENLNYNVQPSYCPEDTPANCEKYGRLYSWLTAMDTLEEFSSNTKGCNMHSKCSTFVPTRGICPEGWHLPDDMEWKELLINIMGDSLSLLALMGETLFNSTFGVSCHEYLKQRYCDSNFSLGSHGGGPRLMSTTTDWSEDISSYYGNGNYFDAREMAYLPQTGRNSYGFSVLPAGQITTAYTRLHSIGSSAYFWSSTESFENYGAGGIFEFAYTLYVGYLGSASLGRSSKGSLSSIRCIKD